MLQSVAIIFAIMSIFSCNNSVSVDLVKNDYLKAFGNEVSIGEAFDFVSKNKQNGQIKNLMMTDEIVLNMV